MENWITGIEIIELGYSNLPNIVIAINSGEVVAYSINTFKRLDWEYLEEQFTDFQEYKHSLRYTYQNDLLYFTEDSNILYMIPWDILYKKMKRTNSSINISAEQYRELDEGWCYKRMSEYALLSIYKESEIHSIFKKSNKDKSNTIEIEEKSAIQKLEILDIELIQDTEATHQQKIGFEVFKKTITKKFRTGIRAAVAIIAYCHNHNAKLRKSDLIDILDRPESFPGAEALIEYRGKISKDLIEDIYKELPLQFRHERGEKKQ